MPASLDDLPSAGFGPHHREHAWQLMGPVGATATVPYVLVTDDIAQLRSATLLGVGVAQLPTMVVGKDIADGKLVDILPDWRPTASVVHAAFPSRRGLLPAVRGLIDHPAAEYAFEMKTNAQS